MKGRDMEFGDFQGKHVVVTGGTGALGSAVVGALLEAGAQCHVPNFDAGEMNGCAFKGHQQVHITQGIDLTEEDSVHGFYDTLPGLWASVQIAGGFAMSPIAETSGAAFMAQMTMNALSCFLCCREAVKKIRLGSEGGRLVNVAARPALEPRTGSGMVAYTASKAAVAALTQALAEELADERIWVNAVAPSILDTPANRQAMPGADHDRWPRVEEVASTILHLASPANGTVRGAVVPVYGAA